jgi:putative flippase GtrA
MNARKLPGCGEHRVSEIEKTSETSVLLSRFGIVGVLATLTYLIMSNVLMLTGVVPTLASITGYLAGMIVSFLGQSKFTFRIGRARRHHLVRFCLLSLIGLFLSYLTVAAASAASVPPVLGTIATAVLVPIVSFVAMKLWVFREAA